jgi:cysteinyl-tRNA synthetase
LAAWLKIDSVFGLGNRPEAEASPEIMALVEARGEAKKARDFAKADALRQQLKALGWLVEDTAKGPKLKRL